MIFCFYTANVKIKPTKTPEVDVDVIFSHRKSVRRALTFTFCWDSLAGVCRLVG